MIKRSEGIKRITLIISVLSVIGWISYVGVASNGFSQVQPLGWLIFAGGSFIAYFIPQLETLPGRPLNYNIRSSYKEKLII